MTPGKLIKKCNYNKSLYIRKMEWLLVLIIVILLLYLLGVFPTEFLSSAPGVTVELLRDNGSRVISGTFYNGSRINLRGGITGIRTTFSGSGYRAILNVKSLNKKSNYVQSRRINVPVGTNQIPVRLNPATDVIEVGVFPLAEL